MKASAKWIKCQVFFTVHSKTYLPSFFPCSASFSPSATSLAPLQGQFSPFAAPARYAERSKAQTRSPSKSRSASLKKQGTQKGGTHILELMAYLKPVLRGGDIKAVLGERHNLTAKHQGGFQGTGLIQAWLLHTTKKEPPGQVAQ